MSLNEFVKTTKSTSAFDAINDWMRDRQNAISSDNQPVSIQYLPYDSIRRYVAIYDAYNYLCYLDDCEHIVEDDQLDQCVAIIGDWYVDMSMRTGITTPDHEDAFAWNNWLTEVKAQLDEAILHGKLSQKIGVNEDGQYYRKLIAKFCVYVKSTARRRVFVDAENYLEAMEIVRNKIDEDQTGNNHIDLLHNLFPECEIDVDYITEPKVVDAFRY